MRRRKLLLHIGFWFAYVAPGLLSWLLGHTKFPSSEAFIVYSMSTVLQAAIVFYLLTEWLLPFCLQAKGLQRFAWLSLGVLWLVASYTNMWLETVLQRRYFATEAISENTPDILDYMLGMFWFMVIAIGITLGHLWYENQLKEKDMQNLQTRAELEYLRYRVNPHFLFNMLNSLYALALDKSESTPQVVLRLAQLMRYMLQNEDQEVPLKSEIEYLQNYLELEKMRLGNHVEIRMNVDGEINGQLISPMLLLPFVENSFKHGINSSVIEGYVEVAVRVVHKELFFYVENSKSTGILTTPSTKQHSGLGLMNVRRRLELLYGLTRFNLEIEETNDKYCVNLYLKLK